MRTTTRLTLISSMFVFYLWLGGGQIDRAGQIEEQSTAGDVVSREAIAQETKTQTKLWTNIDSLLAKVPPGKTVEQSQFDLTFSTDQAALLRQAGLLRIESKVGSQGPDHFVLVFSYAGTAHTQSGDLIHDKIVEFDAQQVGGQYEMSHIKGVAARAIIKVTVDDVKLFHFGDGNTRLTGHGRKVIPLGSKSFIFGPDGRQITDASALEQEK